MSRFRTIFFDFDGTLGNTEPDILQAWHNTFEKLELDCPRFKQVFRVGPPLPDAAKMLFPDVSDAFRQKIQETYKAFYDEAETYLALPYPGIIETVKSLAADGVKIFVATNKRLKPARKLMDKFGLSECCAGLVTPDIVDPEHPLTCGIEIRVQPPGKQVKTITLLSGGEKAFVAIALYFAILKVRPTPFCMVDEIDAALDDRNVERFAKYLHNLSKKTQFIVITHRRGTMEASDVLYGVTMQEQGVSKLLRLDLNQMEEYLGIVE